MNPFAENSKCRALAQGRVPWVVGTVYSAATLAAARALPPRDAGRAAGPDLLELRVDHFAGAARVDSTRWRPRPPRPLLVTVRHPAEGGAARRAGRPAARRRLYERFLPAAAFVDMEVRSLRALAGTWCPRRGRAGVRVVASFHDFHGDAGHGAAARAGDGRGGRRGGRVQGGGDDRVGRATWRGCSTCWRTSGGCRWR